MNWTKWPGVARARRRAGVDQNPEPSLLNPPQIVARKELVDDMKHTGFTIVALMISMTVAAESSSAQDRPGCAQSEFTRFAELAGDWRVQWTDRIAPEMYT